MLTKSEQKSSATKKTLFLYPSFLPSTGGTELWMYQLARQLKDRGYEMSVACNNTLHGAPAKLPEKESVEGIQVRRFKYYPLPFERTLFLSPSVVPYLFKVKADVFQIFGWPTIFISFIACLAARFRKIPLVICPQYFPPYRYRFQPERLRRWVMCVAERLAGPVLLKMADCVVALTEREAEFYRQQKWAKRIIIIREPVFAPREPESGQVSETKAKYGLNDEKTLLFVGRIVANKGLGGLIRSLPGVLEQFPQVRLFVVGKDNGEQANCQALTRELNCQKSVVFTGPVSDLELACFYKLADVVVIPSAHEGYGRIVIEAWLSRKPVVVTRNVGLAEMVTPQNGMVVDYGDIPSLANAITKLLGDKELAISMGASGFELATREITWAKALDQLENMYSEIARR